MKYHQNLSVSIWFICLLAFFLWDVDLKAQNETQNQVLDLLTNANQVYGPNEMLENGRLYIPGHPKAKGNPYLVDVQWMKGNLTVKGDVFNDVLIKYNVSNEQLILKKESDTQESHVPIILNNNFIDSFEIEGRVFVNLNTMPFIIDLTGFVELIYEGKVIFMIKYNKEFINRYSQSNPYGAYSKLNSTYYLYEDEILTRLSTKNSLLNHFEPHKKEIKKFLRQQNIRYKKATSKQLYKLIKYCDEISIVE